MPKLKLVARDKSSVVSSQWSVVRKSKGFTLIELLIVIAIISLLVVLATFSYGNVQKKARDSRRKQDLADIKKALQLYYDDNGNYPALADNTHLGSYLTPLPQDPSLQANYIYLQLSGGYSLTACLENPNDPQKDLDKNSGCTTTSASYTIYNPA